MARSIAEIPATRVRAPRSASSRIEVCQIPALDANGRLLARLSSRSALASDFQLLMERVSGRKRGDFRTAVIEDNCLARSSGSSRSKLLGPKPDNDGERVFCVIAAIHFFGWAAADHRNSRASFPEKSFHCDQFVNVLSSSSHCWLSGG